MPGTRTERFFRHGTLPQMRVFEAVARLGSFTRAQVRQKVEEAAFTANLATACKTEETAFRTASVATDVAAKISRATAERNAQEEIGYIHENAVETFKSALPAEAPQ